MVGDDDRSLDHRFSHCAHRTALVSAVADPRLTGLTFLNFYTLSAAMARALDCDCGVVPATRMGRVVQAQRPSARLYLLCVVLTSATDFSIGGVLRLAETVPTALGGRAACRAGVRVIARPEPGANGRDLALGSCLLLTVFENCRQRLGLALLQVISPRSCCGWCPTKFTTGFASDLPTIVGPHPRRAPGQANFGFARVRSSGVIAWPSRMTLPTKSSSRWPPGPD